MHYCRWEDGAVQASGRLAPGTRGRQKRARGATPRKETLQGTATAKGAPPACRFGKKKMTGISFEIKSLTAPAGISVLSHLLPFLFEKYQTKLTSFINLEESDVKFQTKTCP